MSFFISPADESPLEIDPHDLDAGLRARWANAQIAWVENPASNRVLEWTIRITDELEGYLNRSRQMIHLDAIVEDAAEFATWFRQRTPLQYELHFYDESYTADVPLTAATTTQDIVRAFA